MYFTITGVKKIVRYTEDFVIYRVSLYRGSIDCSFCTLTLTLTH